MSRRLLSVLLLATGVATVHVGAAQALTLTGPGAPNLNYGDYASCEDHAPTCVRIQGGFSPREGSGRAGLPQVGTDAVITRYRVSMAVGGRVGLRTYAVSDSAGQYKLHYTRMAATPLVPARDDHAVDQDVRVPLRVGESIGFVFADGAAPWVDARGSSSGYGTQGVESTAPGDPAGGDLFIESFPEWVIFEAVLEPDVDSDGFGDESQDDCIGTAGPDAGCPAPTTDPATTTTPPVVPPTTTTTPAATTTTSTTPAPATTASTPAAPPATTTTTAPAATTPTAATTSSLTLAAPGVTSLAPATAPTTAVAPAPALLRGVALRAGRLTYTVTRAGRARLLRARRGEATRTIRLDGSVGTHRVRVRRRAAGERLTLELRLPNGLTARRAVG